jgi:PKD repeat protein
MDNTGQRYLTLIIIFLLGIVAGSGLGYTFGRRAANMALEQQLAQANHRFETVNSNYLILVQEYNKLFSLNRPQTAGVAVTAIQPEMYQVPAAEQTEPVSAAEPASDTEMAEPPPTSTQAPAPAEPEPAVALPVAEFEAESVGGTGPLEGPPPQPFRFTDLSTGEITSWEWDFGDGNTSTDQNPKHTIRSCPNDLCTIKLTVCGPGGCDTEEKIDYLWVSESCTGC